MNDDIPQTTPGESFPLGAHVTETGVNFSVFSQSAERVELLLFDSARDAEPSRIVALDPRIHKTFHYWHCHLAGLGPGQAYGWRMDGPHLPRAGRRFDGQRLLIDPYGRAIENVDHYERRLGRGIGGDYSRSLKSVVAGAGFDWEGDVRPERNFSQTVIYEMHVGGFTRHPNSGLTPELRGTYRGLIDKIGYLVDLGVTAVELLPVFQFDVHDAPGDLPNYWGYSPISFFAPHGQYSSQGDGLAALDEFREMVKALHRAEIEVILDVVYNHTAEGDERGPTYSFRGLDNSTYYMLDDRGHYRNYSGCGNTVNANASVVRRLILDSLRYWVSEMHIDGFRFDLASILSRDETGEPMVSPPLLWDIDTDPVLAGTKLIAEAWDASGLYQLGDFFGDHWKEWNGKFRDDMRAFFRGDSGALVRAAPRILASPDLFGGRGGSAERSVNFITSHDGFTLNDLVSYDRKHNEANLEKSRDGDDHNLSRNWGVEGPTDDPEIEALRSQQIRNFFTVTLLSLGVPMILMGDEIRRTQNGNNNPYCQDNETSWLDWSKVDEHAGLRRFVSELILLRRGLPMHRDNRGRSLEDLLDDADVLRWHGVNLDQPDWGDDSRSVALEVRGPSGTFFLILNAWEGALEFELPVVGPAARWRRMIDTSLPSPQDVLRFDEAPLVEADHYSAQPRSVVVLSAALAVVQTS